MLTYALCTVAANISVMCERLAVKLSRLLSCFSSSLVAIPVYVKHNISFREGSSQGRFDLTLGPKQTMGKAVESVLVSSQLPRGVLNANLNPSQGTYTFDPVTKVLKNMSVCVCLCVPKKRRGVYMNMRMNNDGYSSDVTQ